MLKSPIKKTLENTLTLSEHKVENKVSNTPCALGGLYNRQTQNLQEFKGDNDTFKVGIASKQHIV